MQGNSGYKYLTFIVMFYMTIKLIPVVLLYKIILIGPFSASASTLIMPLWFVIGDLITEVYGYKLARQVIWVAIICQFIFALTCASFLAFKIPIGWANQEAYNQVLGNLPRVAFASFIAIITGAFINSYALSKWKILSRGKYFWLRSLGASAVGELSSTIIAYFFEFMGIIPLLTLFKLIMVSYGIKLIMNLILIIPLSYIVFVLKKSEGLDVYDYGINYNPFKFQLDKDNGYKAVPIKSETI